jgi:hypothetical protein
MLALANNTSAVNNFLIENSGAGSFLQILAVGSDPNIGLYLAPKGSGGIMLAGAVGFQGTGPIAKPNVTGACAGNTAIKTLLIALAAYGLVTDSTSA